MTDRENQIAEILADWRQAKNEGEPADPDHVIARHPELADELLDQAAVLGPKAGDNFIQAYLQIMLGSRALDRGDYEQAGSSYRESLSLLRDLNDLTGVGCVFAGLGTIAWLQGDHDRALQLHQESLTNFRDTREGSTIAWCLMCLNGGVIPAGGLRALMERHNERLDLSPEDWSRVLIAEAGHRPRTEA